ncbi:MAG TPA: tripartite tricarboxylate transporter substrate binding protein [Stellaceae bacterium]|jgi:tripartite-type tricarboxylate transporter receptor subunit TctC|nr:tripartite tricarboxylate transporter substrate binding protein [Stellaceae bacterium]
MQLHRRRFLRLLAVVPGLPAVMRSARAQTYPSRPVRIIVGFAAGGTPDIVARVVGQWLSERLGQQVVVENRTGAGGNIAVETVVNAPGDGYTLLLVPTAAAINATLYDNLNFNFIRDIAPVAGVTRIPNIMLVNPSLPVHSVAEFITYAKANPGRVNMASAGVGSGPHLAGELFKVMAGVDMVHVPYRGGPPALKDLIAGQVQVLFINGSVNEDIRAGRLRALAVTSATRSAEFPGVPTVSEFLPGYEASTWFGIGAPKNTPVEVIDRLNKEINAGLADPKVQARFADMGGTRLAGSPESFRQLIADETDKWAKIIRFAGIKLDE